MEDRDLQLRHLLTGQPFGEGAIRPEIVERRIEQVRQFVDIENGIAVLSDLKRDLSYIFSGDMGRLLGLEPGPMVIPSIFEDDIFGCIPPDELVERHVLELRYFQFQSHLPVEQRHRYHTACVVHFNLPGGRTIAVLHRTYYLERLDNGSVWLSVCLYTPSVVSPEGFVGQIIDSASGVPVPIVEYEQHDQQMLSPREKEVLRLLAQGLGSKQIASRLCISTNTVYRHRQNILAALQVNNTAAAVQIGLRLRIIS